MVGKIIYEINNMQRNSKYVNIFFVILTTIQIVKSQSLSLTSHNMWGVQSGPNQGGLTSSGSMMFDHERNLLLLTGTVKGLKNFPPLGDFENEFSDSSITSGNNNKYNKGNKYDDSDCFIAVVQDGKWQSQSRLGMPTSSCFVATTQTKSDTNSNSHGGDHWYIAGYHQQQEQQPQDQTPQTSLSQLGNFNTKQQSAVQGRTLTYEMVVDIGLTTENDRNAIDSVSPTLVHEHSATTTSGNSAMKAIVPSAMTSDGHSLFVATLQSEYETIDSSNFALGVHKVTVIPSTTALNNNNSSTDGSSILEDWSRVFENDSIHKPSVVISALQYVATASDNGVLLVAGSAPGGLTSSEHPLLGMTSGIAGDWEGFVTKLDPKTGEALTEEQNEGLPYMGNDYSRSISSQPSADDFVHGTCTAGNAIYVVGSTGGIFDGDTRGGAYIMKLNLDTLNIQWKTQIPHPTKTDVIHGFACAVTADDEPVVYLAGEVYDGHKITDYYHQIDNNNNNSHHHVIAQVNRVSGDNANLEGAAADKDDDVFVAQLSTRDGSVNWIRQVGTAGYDEAIAKGGGNGGLGVDQNGNAVLYGTTLGSLARQKTADESAHESDVFVLAFHRDDGSNILENNHNNENKNIIQQPDYALIPDENENKTASLDSDDNSGFDQDDIHWVAEHQDLQHTTPTSHPTAPSPPYIAPTNTDTSTSTASTNKVPSKSIRSNPASNLILAIVMPMLVLFVLVVALYLRSTDWRGIGAGDDIEIEKNPDAIVDRNSIASVV